MKEEIEWFSPDDKLPNVFTDFDVNLDMRALAQLLCISDFFINGEKIRQYINQYHFLKKDYGGIWFQRAVFTDNKTFELKNGEWLAENHCEYGSGYPKYIPRDYKEKIIAWAYMPKGIK